MGIALLTAALFFRMDTAAASQPQAVTPMPTPNRLAEPTLPASPSQADYGAQVYWLACLPCHGDRGQGLTDEFRTTYPLEDRNCWNSGCHGTRPYEDGFTLPEKVPALVGPGTLQKFPNAANLRGYIFATMPFWKPSSLTEEETWQVTAFLLRQNGLWQGTAELSESNAQAVKIAGVLTQAEVQARTAALFAVISIGVLIILALIIILKKSRNTTTI